MWIMKSINSVPYGIRATVENADYLFVLTDFITIWKAHLNKKDLCNISKSCNPLMEVEEETFVQETLRLFASGRNDVKWSVDINDENLCLNLESYFSSLPFKFAVSLEQSDPKMFYREITLPLFAMLYELQRRQTVLYDLLRRKDSEIIEYKMDAPTKVTVSDATPMFDVENFKKTQDVCIMDNASNCIKPAFADPLGSLYETVYHMLRKGDELKSNNDDSTTHEEMKNKGSRRPRNKKKNVRNRQKFAFDDDDNVCDDGPIESKSELEKFETVANVKKMKRNERRKLINL